MAEEVREHIHNKSKLRTKLTVTMQFGLKSIVQECVKERYSRDAPILSTCKDTRNVMDNPELQKSIMDSEGGEVVHRERIRNFDIIQALNFVHTNRLGPSQCQEEALLHSKRLTRSFDTSSFVPRISRRQFDRRVCRPTRARILVLKERKRTLLLEYRAFCIT